MLIEFVSSLLRRRRRKLDRAHIVTTWSELASLQPHWERLYAQTPNANFFQSWLWFETYWRYFGSQQQLRIVTVEDSSGTLHGILPLVIRTDDAGLHSRRLTYPLDNWGTEYGPLGPQSEKTLLAALGHLGSMIDDWDVLDLRWVPADRTAELRAALRSAGLSARQSPWNRTSKIDLRSGWEAYWASRTSKFRNNQRRAEKGLKRLGEVRTVHFCPAPGDREPRWDLFDACERVAGESWQGASPVGMTLGHERIQPFLREMHVRAVRAGRLYLSLLFVDDAPAAFTYNYRDRGVVHGLRMGYDVRFRDVGAGGALLTETIQESCRRGDQFFDLGESPSAYKRHWETDVAETFRLRRRCLTRSIGRLLRF